MQQHTGQHVLSAAFDRLFENRTTSFHMGAEVSTIDLMREVTPADVERAVDEANRVVWEDREVSVRFVSADEAARLPLRKEPVREGTLRLVEISDFDLSACGGTHVSPHRSDRDDRRHERRALSRRLEADVRLRCPGVRACFESYRDAVAGAVRVLSVLPHELPGAIERAQLEAKDLRKTVSRLQGIAGWARGGTSLGRGTCVPESIVSSCRPSRAGMPPDSKRLPARSQRRATWRRRSCLVWRSPRDRRGAFTRTSGSMRASTLRASARSLWRPRRGTARPRAGRWS